jgi:thiol-disulfide isomerase/thioredoxin
MRGNQTRHPRGLPAFLHGLACALPMLVASPALAVGVGDAAPTFSARSLHGESTLSLSAYRGKVVYLDFWASWCAPCLTSLPLLEKLRKEFPSDRFQILAVNVDREPDKARSFLARHPIGYPSASDPEGRLPASFGIETMPTSFLIDERGVVRLVHPGFRASDIDSIREHVRTLLEKRR